MKERLPAKKEDFESSGEAEGDAGAAEGCDEGVPVPGGR